MTNLLKTFIILSIIISGCATRSDVKNVQEQIDQLHQQTTSLTASINDSQQIASQADISATSALEKATIAAKLSEETNQKLNTYLEK